MTECLFCRIVRDEVPATKVFENDQVLGFKDINPVAPIHLLFIPKIHVENFFEASQHRGLIDEVFQGISSYLVENNLSTEHFRLVSNMGERAGQSVFHLHFHLIGNRSLNWPPG